MIALYNFISPLSLVHISIWISWMNLSITISILVISYWKCWPLYIFIRVEIPVKNHQETWLLRRRGGKWRVWELSLSLLWIDNSCMSRQRLLWYLNLIQYPNIYCVLSLIFVGICRDRHPFQKMKKPVKNHHLGLLLRQERCIWRVW